MLSLVTILLLTGGFLVVASHLGNILVQLNNESSLRQRTTISEITTDAMTRMTNHDMARANTTEASFADELSALHPQGIQLEDAFTAAGARLELELLENEYEDGGFDSEMEYLFTALLIKLKVPYYAYLPIGIFLRFVSVPLAGVEVESSVLNVLLGYFLPVGETSYFPFLNFYFYSAAGMLIGKIFADRQISTRTFKVIFWECTALLAGFFLSAKFNGFNLKDFYDLSSDSMQSPLHPMMFKFIPAALILLITFALFHFLLLKIDKNSPVLRFARFCGVHLNTIYIVHWILIAYLSLLFDILDFKLSFEMTMLAGLAITVVSLIITRLLPDVNLSQNLSLPGKKKPQVSDREASHD